MSALINNVEMNIFTNIPSERHRECLMARENFFFFFLVIPYSLQNLSSVIRDQTQGPAVKAQVLATGLPGNFLKRRFWVVLAVGYVGSWASQVALVVKNPPADAGDIKDQDLILGSGSYPGVGNGNLLQYSCL